MEIIKDYKYGYKVSNYGYIISPKGVKLITDKKGQVHLYNGSKRLNIRVSRVVVETFISNLTNDQIVRYIDGNCTNCHVDNLQIWHKSHYQSYFSMGNQNVKKIVDFSTANLIKKIHQGSDITAVNLAKLTGLSESTISRIVRNEYYSPEKMSVV